MNFLKNLLILFSIVFMMPEFFAQEKLPLIPYPQKVETRDGFFKIQKTIKVNADLPMHEANKIFFAFNLFNKSKIIFKKGAKSSQISFGLLPPKSGNRAKDYYEIKIYQSEIIISSDSEVGRFNGINTLFQLFNFYEKEGKNPCMEITDSPKFAWRGMHLDCSRHFFTVDEVKKYSDYLAMYKFNTFHWHLTCLLYTSRCV